MVGKFSSLRMALLCAAIGCGCASEFIAPQPAGAQQAQSQFDYKRALANLQAIRNGTKTFQQLSPQEQTEVQVLARMLSRPSAPEGSSECHDAWDRASSAAIDVSDYSRRLQRCVEAGDYQDDCHSAFRSVKSAYDDYESAVSDVSTECD